MSKVKEAIWVMVIPGSAREIGGRLEQKHFLLNIGGKLICPIFSSLLKLQVFSTTLHVAGINMACYEARLVEGLDIDEGVWFDPSPIEIVERYGGDLRNKHN